MSNGGKGSRQRPFDYEAFAANYDRIFGKQRRERNDFDRAIMKDEYYDLEDKDINNNE